MLVGVCLQVFIGQYENFKREMEDMEQRLGQIVCLAFDECSSCESAGKVYRHIKLPSSYIVAYMCSNTVAGDDGSTD